MWIARGLEALQPAGPVALTIGAFDGVHRGHQALLSDMSRAAHETGMRALAMTFDPLPWQVFKKSDGALLSTLEERLSLIEPLDIDGTVILPFTPEMAAIPAADFVTQLIEHLGMTQLWAGPDFALGRGREGSIPFLEALGKKRGFEVQVQPPFFWRNAPVRSSRIREALKRGDLEEANGCLGRPYRLTGAVIHGEARGRKMGFPTLNLDLPADRLLPAYGVYICRVQLGPEHYAAVTNVGIRPTFTGTRATVEAYVLDYSADCYGQIARLDFLHQLRQELRFDSITELIQQMHIDVAKARDWLIHHPAEGWEKNNLADFLIRRPQNQSKSP